MQGEMEKVQQSEKKKITGVGGEDRKTYFQAFVDPIPHESFCP